MCSLLTERLRIWNTVVVESQKVKRLLDGLKRALLQFTGEWLVVERNVSGRAALVPRHGKAPVKVDLSAHQPSAAGLGNLVTMNLDGDATVFAVQAKQVVHPGDLPTLLSAFREATKRHQQQDLRLLVVSGRVSKGAQEALRKEGASYYDESGNLCLFGRNFQVQQEGERTSLRMPTGVRAPFNLGSPKASRVVRMLLASSPEMGFGVRASAATVRIGAGYASTVLRALQHSGYLRREGDHFYLDHRADLLDAWVSQPKRFARKVQRYRVFVAEPTVLEKQVEDVCARKGLRHAFTLWGAANRFAPMTLNPMVAVYCDEPDTLVENLPNSEIAERDENFWLMTPRDEGVYQFSQPAGSVTVVHPVQLYYDLMHAPHRGKAVAEMLREKVLGY
jgi:hypothetical protein